MELTVEDFVEVPTHVIDGFAITVIELVPLDAVGVPELAGSFPMRLCRLGIFISAIQPPLLSKSNSPP